MLKIRRVGAFFLNNNSKLRKVLSNLLRASLEKENKIVPKKNNKNLNYADLKRRKKEKPEIT